MVLGISGDKVSKQARFKEKYRLPYRLLADTDHSVSEAFGVWVEKKFMGRTYMGINRTTVLIDPNGNVARVFDKVTPAGHSAEILTALAELSG